MYLNLRYIKYRLKSIADQHEVAGIKNVHILNYISVGEVSIVLETITDEILQVHVSFPNILSNL
jgi:hypothetical protein